MNKLLTVVLRFIGKFIGKKYVTLKYCRICSKRKPFDVDLFAIGYCGKCIKTQEFINSIK